MGQPLGPDRAEARRLGRTPPASAPSTGSVARTNARVSKPRRPAGDFRAGRSFFRLHPPTALATSAPRNGSGCSSGVEHYLAKVRVVSSNLITRSSFDPPDSRRQFDPPGRAAFCMSRSQRVPACPSRLPHAMATGSCTGRALSRLHCPSSSANCTFESHGREQSDHVCSHGPSKHESCRRGTSAKSPVFSYSPLLHPTAAPATSASRNGSGCSSGVEHYLAKVRVVSSNLITRSSFDPPEHRRTRSWPGLARRL